MRKAVGYIRVSTKHQGRYGCGLEGQKAAIEAFAKSEGYELLAVERDIWTARGPSSIMVRPGLASAISLAQLNDAVIIAWDAKRVSRDLVSFSALRKLPLPRIIGILETAASEEAIFDAQVARAEIEGSHLVKRTREGMARAKQRGAVFADPATLSKAREKGVLENIRLADEFLVKVTGLITCYRAAGKSTANELAGALNADGILSPHGKTWTKDNIRHILRRIKKLSQPLETEQSEIR